MENVETLEAMALPFNKQVEFQKVTYENNFTMLRLRFREGKRFTMVDLDPDSARHWIKVLSDFEKNATTG